MDGNDDDIDGDMVFVNIRSFRFIHLLGTHIFRFNCSRQRRGQKSSIDKTCAKFTNSFGFNRRAMIRVGWGMGSWYVCRFWWNIECWVLRIDSVDYSNLMRRFETQQKPTDETIFISIISHATRGSNRNQNIRLILPLLLPLFDNRQIADPDCSTRSFSARIDSLLRFVRIVLCKGCHLSKTHSNSSTSKASRSRRNASIT